MSHLDTRTQLETPSVSVVIPTFRRERDVVEAVRSALAQDGVVLEVIVLDDSPEGSAAEAIAALGEPRVRYVRRAVPTGGNPAVVRNEGLALARGGYVHFLDDDDVLEPGALRAAVAALERTGAGVAVGFATPFGDDAQALAYEKAYFDRARLRLRAARSRYDLVATMLFESTPIVNSVCTVRRACALSVGGYSPAVRIVEDVDFYLRAVRQGDFALVDCSVVRYRTGHASMMHSLRDLSILRRSYGEIYRQYRRDRGSVEFLALRLLATVRRAVRVLLDQRWHAAAAAGHASAVLGFVLDY